MAVDRRLAAAALLLTQLRPAASRPGEMGWDYVPPPILGHQLGGARMTFLPQEAGDESPACLDGSPYGFYFVPASGNSTRWTISIQGGGWCYDEKDCFGRSKTALGSSSKMAKDGGCECMNVHEDGSAADCNCLFMPYCDGASFSGFRRSRWPVPGSPDDTLVFRGIKNLDATLEWASAHGLDKATEFVLTGGSAGGLSTFLHADRVASWVQSHAAPGVRVRAAPVVGFFLDHDNFAHDEHSYTARMKYIYGMQNLTFGADGGLTAACREAYPDSPHYCFMSPHMQHFVNTPFFVFNSKYDTWQLSNELQVDWEAGEAYDAVLEYGRDFMKQFQPLLSERANGAFITTCLCHGCPWTSLELDGKSSMQLYADWLHGKSAGRDAIHVDARGPNGDDELVAIKGCLRIHHHAPEAAAEVLV